MSRAARLAPLAGGLLVLVPGAAQAHLASTRFGDFYAGMLHPATALEHLLPIFALGLLAGLQEPRVGRWILLAVPTGLLAGVLLAQLGPAPAAVAWVNRASFVVLGLLVAGGWRLPAALLVALAAAFAVTHGYENGTALGEGAKLHLFALGGASAGLITVALAAAAALSLQRRADWIRIAVRTAGSWIAAVGLIVVVV